MKIANHITIQPSYLLTALLLLTVVAAQAQTVLTADQLQNGQAVELDKLGWKYSPDDEPRFADPQFDDGTWEMLKGTALGHDLLPKNGWLGIGWFRFHLRITPELAEVPLNLEMSHLGASEIYLDGKLIGRFGVVGKTRAEEVGFNPNALPLGVVTKYTYQQRELSLNSGDVIVLMSDGLPERFNEANEMLEDESAKIFITENAHLSSQELINGLVILGDEWGGVRQQDDDVTFVVVKMR